MRCRVRSTTLLPFVVLLLAGCATPVAEPPAPEAEGRVAEQGESEGTFAGAFEAEDCQGVLYVAYVPAAAVEPELPPAFPTAVALRPSLPEPAWLAYPHLAVVTCASLRVGDVVERDVSLAYSGVHLASGEFYRWETFVDEEGGALASFLQSAGWPTWAAAITLGPTGADIQADGISYSLLVPVGSPHEKLQDEPMDIHNLGADGVHRRLSEEFSSAGGGYTGTLTADGGVWSRILGRVAPVPFTALSSGIHSDLRAELYVGVA